MFQPSCASGALWFAQQRHGPDGDSPSLSGSPYVRTGSLIEDHTSTSDPKHGGRGTWRNLAGCRLVPLEGTASYTWPSLCKAGERGLQSITPPTNTNPSSTDRTASVKTALHAAKCKHQHACSTPHVANRCLLQGLHGIAAAMTCKLPAGSGCNSIGGTLDALRARAAARATDGFGAEGQA